MAKITVFRPSKAQKIKRKLKRYLDTQLQNKDAKD